MKKSNLKIKLLLSLLSFTLSLCLLEVSLRLTGLVVLYQTQKEYIPPYDEKNTEDHDNVYELYKGKDKRGLLLVGDSFTNGGNVQTYDSYPYYLYRTMVDNRKGQSVINFGECESSTFDAYERIKKMIDDKKEKKKRLPDKIVLLIGSADLFAHSFGKVNERSQTFLTMPIVEGFKSFRIYKIFRIIKYEFFKYFSFVDYIRLPPDSAKKIDGIETVFSYVKDIFLKEGRDYSFEDSLLIKKQLGLKFSAEIEKEVFPKEKMRGLFYIEHLLGYLSAIDSRQNKHLSAVRRVIGFAGEYPLLFWKNGEFKYLKYYIIQALKLQSSLGPKDILKILKMSLKEIDKTEDFKKFENVMINWEHQIDIVNKRRRGVWAKLVSLSKKENIQLILQNYPSNYSSANQMIKSIAKIYQLPLVDNNKIFSKLIEKDGREKYLYDDDHCTPEGYKVMANNVYRVINGLK